MKKAITVMLIVVLMIGIVFTICSCEVPRVKYAKYIRKYMDCIPKDVEDYELVHGEYGNPEIKDIEDPITINVETSRGLEEITIFHDDQPNKTYSITTPRETIVVNDEYLMNNVVEYALVKMMWHMYDGGKYYDKRNSIVCVFDNNIFLVVSGYDTTDILGPTPGQIPALLFLFDVETNKFLYAGYMEDLTLIGHNLKIVKKVNI